MKFKFNRASCILSGHPIPQRTRKDQPMGIFSHPKQTMYIWQGESVEMREVWGAKEGFFKEPEKAPGNTGKQGVRESLSCSHVRKLDLSNVVLLVVKPILPQKQKVEEPRKVPGRSMQADSKRDVLMAKGKPQKCYSWGWSKCWLITLSFSYSQDFNTSSE